jgi:DME family drug/metabolite transporter
MDLPARLSARAGALAISGGALLWGTTGVVVQALHDRTGLSPVSVGCYRLLVASAVLALVRGRDLVRLVRETDRRLAIVLAGAGLGAYQALYFVAVDDAGVSLSTLISLGTAPIVLTAASVVTRRRLPGPGAVATMACAVGGLALVSTSAGSAPGPHPMLGVLAALGSGLAYAGSTVVSRSLAATADPFTLTGASSVIGAVLMLPASLTFGMTFHADGRTVPALMYLGIMTTVVAYGLFFGGLRSTRPEAAAVLTLIEPLTATVLAAALLGESLGRSGTVGAAMLLDAVTYLLARNDGERLDLEQ